MIAFDRVEAGRTVAPAKREGVVFVVDADVAARNAVKRIIERANWRVEAFATAEDFLRQPCADAPGCLILDLDLPGMSGLDLQRKARDAGRDLPAIFVTNHVDTPVIVRAMRAGAVDVLTKPLDDDELLSAVRQAVEQSAATRQHALEMAALRRCHISLTPRQREVMNLVVMGRLNKQVAGELGTSEKTVKLHRSEAMRKMKADSLAELVVMSIRLGLPRDGRRAPL